jgi:hypothetical protein
MFSGWAMPHNFGSVFMIVVNVKITAAGYVITTSPFPGVPHGNPELF